MSEKVSLYNPRDTPPEQLEAMLTGREPLLKEILDSLREQAEAPTRQHWLLRGPRGIGKTHLTGIIHHRVSTDSALSKVYLPLWLGEADVYEVYSPATLLMRIAERLVEAVPGAKLAEVLRTLEGTGDEDTLFEELAAHLTDEAERQERILLVLMENLDALFESFAPKQRTAQTRQLRSLLLGNPRFLFISTTPTRHLKELSDPKAPLFAHLKERRLNPLQVDEVGALFARLAQLTGRKELLGEGPDAALKQRIIHQLTGGLPRSVVMAFEVLRDQEGIQPLVEDLRVFLDAQTAYFEARLSRLAPRERAIVTTLALADQNLTLKEISEKSLLPEKSLSTLVARLEQEGHVETMEGSGGKGTLYGLNEGLFRIWYQYRKGRLLLEPLVRFLAYWYDPNELQGVAEAMQQRLSNPGMKAGHAARLTLLQIEAAVRLATSPRGREERQRLWDECRRAVEEATASNSSDTLDPAIERALSEAITLMFSNRFDEGRAALEGTLAPHEPLPEGMAFESVSVLIEKAYALASEKNVPNAEIFRLIAARFEAHPSARVRFMAGLARLGLAETLYTLGNLQEALHQAEAVLALPETSRSKTSNPLFLFASRMRLPHLYELGRKEEAISATKQLLDELRQDTSTLTQETMHRVLYWLANTYEALGRQQVQEETLQELVQKDESGLPQELQRISAVARLKLIGIHSQSNRFVAHELVAAMDAWFTKHQHLFTGLDTDLLRILKNLRAIADAAMRGEPAPSGAAQFIFQQGLKQVSPGAALNFLRNPAPFLSYVPIKDLLEWLKQLLETDLSVEQKELLRLHLRLIEALEEINSAPPPRHKPGRVPVELQGLFTSLISRLR